MKHRRFRWILFAMTIVLTGVIGLQTFWLDKAVMLEKKNYTERVRDAKVNATARIESKEVLNLITNEFLPPAVSYEVRDCVIVRSDSGIRIRHSRCRRNPENG